MVKRNRRRPSVKVTGDGRGVASHAGSRLPCDMADQVGLSHWLSAAMAPTKASVRGHDRGDVLVDLAVMLAGGGKTISDLKVLRDQPAVFGPVASTPTAWRTLDAIDDETLARIAVGRAEARRAAWAAGADPEFYVIDIDATLVNSHSDKDGAAANYKRGFGFHPMVAFLDATGEPLAGLLRPGNAGANNAADHITVLDSALAQLPIDPADTEVIVRTDSAGCTHGFVNACVARQVNFVVGHALTAEIAQIIAARPKRAWRTAITADGTDERDGAQVLEITDHVDLTKWPPGTRLIARREHAHPGAQLTYTDIDGHRFQVCLTNMAGDPAFLEALYRGRGRVEQSIAEAKDTGLTNLPSADFAINQAWLILVLIAGDLLAWTRLLCLEGDLARAEPKRLRYCLLHTPAVIATTGRTRHLRYPANWPWTNQLVAAHQRLDGLDPGG